MHDEPSDAPETREAINATLRDILSTDGWTKYHWDTVLKDLRESHGIETDLLELAQNAPGLVRMFQLGALSNKGIIKEETRRVLTEIVQKLVSIAYHADKGDEKAVNQLAVLHKVAHPLSYELSWPVIKNLADRYHTSPHLARAWDVRGLMLVRTLPRQCLSLTF